MKEFIILAKNGEVFSKEAETEQDVRDCIENPDSIFLIAEKGSKHFKKLVTLKEKKEVNNG